LDAVGKPDHADESGLTPIRTRRLKAEETNTTQEKAEMDDLGSFPLLLCGNLLSQLFFVLF
jgi:hypothetical protein